jgi:hypothetical protein
MDDEVQIANGSASPYGIGFTTSSDVTFNDAIRQLGVRIDALGWT